MTTVLAIHPTARKAADQLKRIVRRDGSVAGNPVMTFPQLIESLARELDDSRPPLDRIGERLAIGVALARAPLPGVANPPGPGLIESLLGLIRQLKTAALKPEDLRQAAAGIGLATAIPVATLAAIGDAYQAVLDESGVIDHYDREAGVLAMLHRCETEGHRPRLLAGVERLLIAEIYDLSLLQFMIAASLIRIVGAAEVTIQAQPNEVTSATRFADLTWNRFVGEESIADRTLPEFVNRTGRAGRLNFLIANLFAADPPPAPPADDTVTIIEAPTRIREAEETARAIRRILEAPAGERLAPDRIAIVARDLEPYAEYLEAACRRYRIPLRMAGSRPLTAAPAARAVLDLLRVAAEDFSRDALGRILGSALFHVRAGAHFAVLAEAGYIDRATEPLRERLASRRATLAAEAADPALDERERQRRAALARRIERALPQFAWLRERLEPLAQAAPARTHVDRLRHALAELGFDPAADPLNPDSVDNAAAAGPLAAALDSIAAADRKLAPDRVLSAAEFAAEVAAAFGEANFERPGGNGAAVTLALPVMEARGLDFDTVFVLGLNDQTFPTYHGEDPLIPDDARRQLNPGLKAALRRRYGARAAAAPGPILRTRGHRNAEDPFLFFLALSMPARRVIFSYAAANEAGQPLARSPFIDELVRLLGAAPEPIHKIAAGNFIPPPDDCFDAGEFLNCAADLKMLDERCPAAVAPPAQVAAIARRVEIERARAAYLAMPTREELEMLESSPAKADRAGPYDGRVGADPRLRRLLLGDGDNRRHRWSAGQLGEAASCGFRYFAGRLLRLDEADDPGVEQSALEAGDLAHEVLRELVQRKIDFNDRQRARRDAAATLAEVRARRAAAARDPEFFALQWETVERIVDEFIRYEMRRRAEDGVQPAESCAEHNFDFTIDDPRPRAPDERGAVALTGRIDRIDLFRGQGGKITRMRVVDYKTSRNGARYNNLLKPENFARADFQIPLYALAARREFAAKLASASEIEGGYVALLARDRDKEAIAPLPAERLTLDPDARAAAASGDPVATPVERIPVANRIVDVVGAMVAGRFDVDPLACDDYCPYRRVCRYRKGEA